MSWDPEYTVVLMCLLEDIHSNRVHLTTGSTLHRNHIPTVLLLLSENSWLITPQKWVCSKSLRNNTKLTQDVDCHKGLCGHYHPSMVTTLSPSEFSSPAVPLNLPLSYLSVFHFSLQYTVLNTHKKRLLPILCLVFCSHKRDDFTTLARNKITFMSKDS